MSAYGALHSQTENISNPPLYEKPPVGWLACLSGPLTGQSYTLYDGNNYIGRGQHMTVQILGDPHILHDKHACIAYDSRNREFYLIPGYTDRHIYLESEAVYKATEIVDFCNIRIGTTDLVFRPLCCEKFAWRTQRDIDLEIRAEKERVASIAAHNIAYEQQLSQSYKLGRNTSTDMAKVEDKKLDATTEPTPTETLTPANEAALPPIVDIEQDSDLFDPAPSALTK